MGEREHDPDKSKVDLDGPGLVLSGSLSLSVSLSVLSCSQCLYGPLIIITGESVLLFAN